VEVNRNSISNFEFVWVSARSAELETLQISDSVSDVPTSQIRRSQPAIANDRQFKNSDFLYDLEGSRDIEPTTDR